MVRRNDWLKTALDYHLFFLDPFTVGRETQIIPPSRS